jgi:hypothetical protein
MLFYEIDIAGMKRDLPLCRVSDEVYIAAFVMFGDVELTIHCAAELLKRAFQMARSERTSLRAEPVTLMTLDSLILRIVRAPMSVAMQRPVASASPASVPKKRGRWKSVFMARAQEAAVFAESREKISESKKFLSFRRRLISPRARERKRGVVWRGGVMHRA